MQLVCVVGQTGTRYVCHCVPTCWCRARCFPLTRFRPGAADDTWQLVAKVVVVCKYAAVEAVEAGEEREAALPEEVECPADLAGTATEVSAAERRFLEMILGVGGSIVSIDDDCLEVFVEPEKLIDNGGPLWAHRDLLLLMYARLPNLRRLSLLSPDFVFTESSKASICNIIRGGKVLGVAASGGARGAAALPVDIPVNISEAELDRAVAAVASETLLPDDNQSSEQVEPDVLSMHNYNPICHDGDVVEALRQYFAMEWAVEFTLAPGGPNKRHPWLPKKGTKRKLASRIVREKILSGQGSTEKQKRAVPKYSGVTYRKCMS
jgi:hypothetical protein